MNTYRTMGWPLLKKVSTPLLKNYNPEVDGIPDLDEREADLYQLLMGILRVMVVMGRLGICMEVSAMSSFVAIPREGHLQQLLNLLAYINIHHNAQLLMEPSHPEIGEEDFKKHDWSDLYGDDPDPVPSNEQMPLGSVFMMRAYVDA